MVRVPMAMDVLAIVMGTLAVFMLISEKAPTAGALGGWASRRYLLDAVLRDKLPELSLIAIKHVDVYFALDAGHAAVGA